jgi:hypothetical protein
MQRVYVQSWNCTNCFMKCKKHPLLPGPLEIPLTVSQQGVRSPCINRSNEIQPCFLWKFWSLFLLCLSCPSIKLWTFGMRRDVDIWCSYNSGPSKTVRQVQCCLHLLLTCFSTQSFLSPSRQFLVSLLACWILKPLVHLCVVEILALMCVYGAVCDKGCFYVTLL